MSHYSAAQHNDQLLKIASTAAKAIRKKYNKPNNPIIPSLIYTGMSGISTATAIAQEYYRRYKKNLHMIYVRKDNENSHGSRIETEPFTRQFDFHGNYIPYIPVTIDLIFVDDFVSSGNTVVNVLAQFSEFQRDQRKVEVNDILIIDQRDRYLVDIPTPRMYDSERKHAEKLISNIKSLHKPVKEIRQSLVDSTTNPATL
jgi:orotate phosphoribosyltransferase-like protein